MNVSKPWRAMLASNGEMIEPCAAPSVVGKSFPPSINPALRKALTALLIDGSV